MYSTVDGKNPANHLGCFWSLVNDGIDYQPQLVNAGFLNHQQYCTTGGDVKDLSIIAFGASRWWHISCWWFGWYVVDMSYTLNCNKGRVTVQDRMSLLQGRSCSYGVFFALGFQIHVEANYFEGNIMNWTTYLKFFTLVFRSICPLSLPKSLTWGWLMNRISGCFDIGSFIH